MKRFLPVACLAGLVACAPQSSWDGTMPAQMLRPVSRTSDIRLSVPAAGGLLPSDRARLAAAVDTARASGSLRVEVLSPPSGEPGAVFGALAKLGVRTDRIVRREAPALPTGMTLVRITSTRIAVPAECQPPEPGSGFAGLPSATNAQRIGCVSAANFAAMLADPNDLVGTVADPGGNLHDAVQAIGRQRVRAPSGSGDGRSGVASGGSMAASDRSGAIKP